VALNNPARPASLSSRTGAITMIDCPAFGPILDEKKVDRSSIRMQEAKEVSELGITGSQASNYVILAMLTTI
jgi:hypothetical protein